LNEQIADQKAPPSTSASKAMPEVWRSISQPAEEPNLLHPPLRGLCVVRRLDGAAGMRGAECGHLRLNTGSQGRRVSEKPTLADAGIDKNLANRARGSGNPQWVSEKPITLAEAAEG
jgi:hypothetical protein